jgi:nucleoside-diphosphate-sugar epimerase
MNLGAPLVLISGRPSRVGLRLVQALLEGLPGHPEFAAPQEGLRIGCLLPPGANLSWLGRFPGRVRILIGAIDNESDRARFFDGAAGGVLFHLAHGGVGSGRKLKRSKDGVTALFDDAIRAGIRRIVATSSVAVCGRNPHCDHLFDEHSSVNPRTPAARFLAGMEDVLNERAGRIETAILRLAPLYGPPLTSSGADWIAKAFDQAPVVAGDGRAMVSLLHTDNAVQALLLAATCKAAARGTWFVSDRRTVSQKQIQEVLAGLNAGAPGGGTGGVPTVSRSVCALARVAARTLESVGFFNEKLDHMGGLDNPSRCSPVRAMREMGYDPRLDFQAAIRAG